MAKYELNEEVEFLYNDQWVKGEVKTVKPVGDDGTILYTVQPVLDGTGAPMTYPVRNVPCEVMRKLDAEADKANVTDEKTEDKVEDDNSSDTDSTTPDVTESSADSSDQKNKK